MRIVLGSGNAGKVREFEDLLAPYGHELRSLADYDLEQVAETAHTFIENALLKARHTAQHTGLPCLADDSGLVVAALDGAPGLYSSRYDTTFDVPLPTSSLDPDSANTARLLAELDGQANRAAHFYCALVLVRYPSDPAPLIASGQWRGKIALEPSGDNGFGYDPVFLDATSGQSAATLMTREKRAISHRGKAWHELSKQLDLL